MPSTRPPRRTLAPLALALALSPCAAALAEPASCHPAAPAVSFDEPAPQLDRSLGFDGLASRASSIGNGESVAGLYEPSTRIEYSYRLRSFQDTPTGPVLSCFESVSISIATSSTIHVAAPIPEGGCAYSAVLGHEMGHHSIQVRQTRLAVAAFLAANPLPTLPYASASPQAAQAEAASWFDAYGAALTASLSAFVEPKQAEHDSPVEYARISALCQGEIHALLAGRHRLPAQPPSR